MSASWEEIELTVESTNQSNRPRTAEAKENRLSPEMWVDAYGDRLYGFAFKRLRRHDLAEEVVQETLLSALKYQDSFSGQGSQLSWLFSILKRKIFDAFSNRWKNNRIGIEDEANPERLLFDNQGQWLENWFPEKSPLHSIENREFWDIIQDCLAALPNKQADVFVMSVLDERNSHDICRDLNISLSNLWVRLHRARLGLAKCVGAKWLGDSAPAYLDLNKEARGNEVRGNE